MKKTLKITENQYKEIHKMIHEATNSFLNEMKEFDKTLMEDTMLGEGLVDNLSGKFKDLVQKSGVNGLRHAVSAALVAGSLAGVSPDAIAQAAMKAGVSPEQAKTIGVSKQGNKDFSKDLALLNKRYVVADNDPQKTKTFMKFTGNLSDVTGIEPKNGYPIFAKGSESEKQLQASFANPTIFKGIVNVRGQDLPGNFVESQGLWYTITTPKATPQPAPTTPAPAATSQQQPTDNHANTTMIDFTGLFQGAKQKYQEGYGPDGGKMTPEQKSKYPSLAHYIPDFLRAQDKGFQGMSNQDIRDMFANGMKAEVKQGQFSMGSNSNIATR